MEFLTGAYPWLQAFHIIAVLAWMAGIFYLPRLFVYHVEAGPGSPQAATFIVMERRLLRAIMNPAMIVTWLLGLIMLAVNWEGIMVGQGWMHGKLLLVVLLTGFHMACARWRRRLEAGEGAYSSKFFRIMNEVPTLMVIGIVILAVVKPF